MPLPLAPTQPADTVDAKSAEKPKAFGEHAKEAVSAARAALLADAKGLARDPETVAAKAARRNKAAPAKVEAEQKADAQTPAKLSFKTKKKAEAKKPVSKTHPEVKTEAKTERKTQAKPEAKTDKPVEVKAPKAKGKAKTSARPAADALFADPAKNGAPASPLKAGAKARKGRATVAGRGKRLYVLDTNVLMHDPMSIYAFEEHDVFLPMTVLEELDGHKVGTSEVARNARAVTRAIDTLIDASHGEALAQGLALNADGHAEALGRLYFETQPMGAPLPEDLARHKGDNSILSVVKGLAHHFPQHDAVLVTKDINMRIKAAALGLPAEDYFSDKVIDDSDLLDSGQRRLAPDFWERVGETLQVSVEGEETLYRFETATPSAFHPNMCLWTDTPEEFEGRVVGVDGFTVTVRAIANRRQHSIFGITARNREQNFALDLLLDPDIDFVTLIGQAGTGKTLLTLAAALQQTVDEHRFDEIVVTRATVSVGEEIGYLPGTEEEKMLPWMGAVTDNLEVLTGATGQKKWQKAATEDLLRKYISMKSISFMRGRTFQRKFVLIDEAQNLTPKELKTLITRAGPGTKIVCLGNLSQIDTPYLTEGSSGLTYAVERFLDWAHAGTLTLSRGERSRLSEFAAEHF